MQIAVYGRISTNEKRQSLDTQLLPVHDYCQSHGLTIYKEYLDEASALDTAHRKAWRDLLDDAAKHKFQAVVVFKLDRAFRSVKHMYDTLATWEALGVTFISVREQFDTTSAMGRLFMNLLASLAEFELELIRERINAGMERAKRLGTRSGKPIGRRRVTDTKGFGSRANLVLAQVKAGNMSLSTAARELGISKSTVKRLADGTHASCQKGNGNGTNENG